MAEGKRQRVADYKRYQQQLLVEVRHAINTSGEALEEKITQAFLATPRHLFVKRYRHWGNNDWQEVTAENLDEHLATLYRNDALMLWDDETEEAVSSISQPSLVLQMLQLLQLEPGQRIFELGTGSGWNAALMGRLIGPTGHVYSLEILPELARCAAATVARLGIETVSIVTADAGEGYAPGSLYDRAVFTAGAYDLPRHFYTQLKEGALLLLVLKHDGGGDTLFLLRKVKGHFESLHSFLVGFVPMTGRYALTDGKPMSLAALPDWGTLQQQEVRRTPYWWGGERHHLLARSQGLRYFLSIAEPDFRIFTQARSEETDTKLDSFFGLWDAATHSLVLIGQNELVAYGCLTAQERLLQRLHEWVDVGMPTNENFQLQIYPIDKPLAAAQNQWLVQRQESNFLWVIN